MGDNSATNPRGLVRLAGPLFVLAMLVGSLLLLHRELSGYKLQDFLDGIQQIPAHRLWLAVGLTILNYLILIAYDVLGVKYIGHSLQLVRVALASFLGYAIGNNFGTLFGGATIRYRLYSSWGLSAVDVMKLVLILGVTFWIGLFALASVLFLWHPLQIPPKIDWLHWFLRDTRPLGVILAIPALGYLAICAWCKGSVRIGRWEFFPPPVGLSILQYLVATIDLLVAAAVPYLLLPSSVPTDYPHFVCIYLLAIIAGLMSQVPGGLGVLELVIVVLLNPQQPQEVISAMLAYRLIYYLLPLVIGLILLTSHEVSLHGKHAARALALFGRWSPAIAPRVLALSVFIAGALLVFSGATPVVESRYNLLPRLLPLPVMELAHFTGSIVGALLILLARGLQRRIAGAYYLTCALLGLGILVSLIKGFDLEEAIVLSILLAAFIPSRENFFRKGSLLTERFTASWLVAIACVMVITLWLMYFSYKGVDYTHALWWQFSVDGNAARSLRGFVGAMVTGLVVVSLRLMRPLGRLPDMPTPQDIADAHRIADSSTHSSSHLALVGDKHLLFNGDRTAFVMYGVADNSYIAMGDPVGSPDAMRELAWELTELSDLGGYWPAFYQIDEENMSIYVDMGMSLIQIGEEARVDLSKFRVEQLAQSAVRKTHQQSTATGCALEVIPPAAVVPLLPQLKTISDAWLAGRHAEEKGFSLGYFEEHYLASTPIAVVRKGGAICAFANLWLGANREELSIDMMRFDPDSPPGTIDFLMIELLLWGQQQGYHWFNLGLAPLVGMDASPHGSLWHEIASLTFRHAEHFYNLQSLRQYKEKFEPVWSTKYLASPAGIALPAVLANVSSLIARPYRP